MVPTRHISIGWLRSTACERVITQRPVGGCRKTWLWTSFSPSRRLTAPADSNRIVVLAWAKCTKVSTPSFPALRAKSTGHNPKPKRWTRVFLSPVTAYSRQPNVFTSPGRNVQNKSILGFRRSTFWLAVALGMVIIAIIVTAVAVSEVDGRHCKSPTCEV